MISLKWKDEADPERHTEKKLNVSKNWFVWMKDKKRMTAALILMFCRKHSASARRVFAQFLRQKLTGFKFPGVVKII